MFCSCYVRNWWFYWPCNISTFILMTLCNVFWILLIQFRSYSKDDDYCSIRDSLTILNFFWFNTRFFFVELFIFILLVNTLIVILQLLFWRKRFCVYLKVLIIFLFISFKAKITFIAGCPFSSFAKAIRELLCQSNFSASSLETSWPNAKDPFFYN